MRSLSDLVKLYFPQETFVRSSQARITESNLVKFGLVPLGWGWRWSIFPVDIVETNEKIYFDGRRNILLSAITSLFTGPIFLLGFSYFFYTYSAHEPMPTSFVIFLLVLNTIVGLVNIVLSFGIANIYYLRIKWINNRTDEGMKTALKGTIPEELNSMIFEIPSELRKTLPLLERPRLLFGHSSVATIDFKISYSKSK